MKDRKNVKKAGFRLGLISVLVIGMLVGISSEVYNFGLEQDPDTGSWHVIWEGSLADAAEADPGAGNSGFLSVYFHPHQADIGGYLENSSSNLETNCTDAGLGFANADDTEVDLAHSTEFDCVFRVRGSAANCKVGDTWYDTNLKVQWTCAGLSVGADTELTLGAGEAKTTANNSDYTYLYMNFFDTNSGSGFTITQDQTIEITSIKLLAYY